MIDPSQEPGINIGEMVLHHTADAWTIPIDLGWWHYDIHLHRFPDIHIGSLTLNLSPTKHVYFMLLAATLVFLIAAPAGGGSEHLTILAALARRLVRPAFRQTIIDRAMALAGWSQPSVMILRSLTRWPCAQRPDHSGDCDGGGIGDGVIGNAQFVRGDH